MSLALNLAFSPRRRNRGSHAVFFGGVADHSRWGGFSAETQKIDRNYSLSSGLAMGGGGDGRAGHQLSLGRLMTTSVFAWFFTIMLAGRMPRQKTFG
jgi:hypothetical protein